MIVSLSLPADLRSRVDAEASREKRSRSYVVAEAIRQYLARQERQAFSDARERTLRDGLSLSPSERVKLSEELWQDFAHGRSAAKPWTATFNTFDEYDAWRRKVRTA